MEQQNSRYTNIKYIGYGASGSVEYAYDNLTKTDVALKTILKNKFFRKDEFKILKKIKHPNIVTFHKAYENEKYAVYAYEYCDGGTLRKYMMLLLQEINIQIKEEKIKKILSQLRNAMYCLYQNNIYHCDIKPENIMLCKTSDNTNINIKIIDFGLSKNIQRDEIDNNGNTKIIEYFHGTPIYMAPEILLKNGHNIKADLWSFGVILYELLYGYFPYGNLKTQNIIEELRNIYRCEQKFPYYYGYDYSQQCINLLESLLTINPENRICWECFFSHEWFSESLPVIAPVIAPVITQETYQQDSFDPSEWDIV